MLAGSVVTSVFFVVLYVVTETERKHLITSRALYQGFGLTGKPNLIY